MKEITFEQFKEILEREKSESRIEVVYKLNKKTVLRLVGNEYCITGASRVRILSYLSEMPAK